MENADETAEHRITITIDGVDLPVGEDVRHALLEDLRAELRDLLVESHGVEVNQDDFTVATGYHYAQVPAECPLCSERLDLLSVHLDNENGAYASAVCPDEDCEWSGDAVYRIVDLEGSESNAVESSVLTGEITPNYSPTEVNSMEDTPTFTRIEPICPRDDCDSQLGIGKPVYAGEQTDIAYADIWCQNKECSFTACAQFALVDLLHEDGASQASLVKAGEIEPREARYQR